MPHTNIKPTTAQKSALRKAFPSSIETDFERLQRYFRNKRWLPDNNRYRDNCVERIDRDEQANSLNGAHLSKYIAASALPHAFDGWSFLGRAVGAHLRGDIVSCRHLAYYAELRAAISLLATQGVGIFDRRHYSLDRSGAVVQVPKRDGTHVVTWKALAHWSELKRSGRLLAEIITPGGLAVQEWQSGMFSSTSFRAIGTTWLQKWGVDIQRCADDQHLRNQSSYRPSRLQQKAHLSLTERVDFVKEFWRLCEPSGSEQFQRLDRHLLRMWLRDQYLSLRGQPADHTNPDFVREITELVDRTNPQGLTAGLWTEFLTNPTKYPDSVLIQKSSQKQAGSEHFGMLARSVMLLRLATGACRLLLINSGVAKTDLQFWWHSIGTEMAMWNSSDEPDDPQSLWLDIEAAIQELDNWSATADEQRPKVFRTSQAPALAVIDEAERVALWGIGL